MAIRVGINGFGRIGRNFYRAIQSQGADLEIVAVNDLGSVEMMAHLLKFDSVMGRLDEDVAVADGNIVVGGKTIKVLAERDPAKLPWSDLGVDVVVESTGFFTSREKAAAHLEGGAPFVIVSAPCTEADATFVVGVNDDTFDAATHKIVSNASCTTNCLAPIAKVLHERFGILKGHMVTVHSYTNDQNVLDLPHKDMRRARAAALSMIPTSTGAAKSIGLVLPELKGKLDGTSVRVPTANVSLVCLTAHVGKKTNKDEVNNALRAAANGPLKSILAVEDRPLVSSDFIGDTHSSIVDSAQTQVVGDDLVEVQAWYDNEWGFSNRMVDLARLLATKS
jgi:glyceraldehyde 3-phosphate dehydrogenase